MCFFLPGLQMILCNPAQFKYLFSTSYVNEVIVSLSANVTSLNGIIRLLFAFNSLYNGKSRDFVFTKYLIIEG